MKTLLKISLTLWIFCSVIFADNGAKVQDFLVKAFANKYQLDESDVILRINHLPDTEINNQKLQLVNESNSLNIGFNRSTLQLIRNNKVESQHQITYSAKIEIEVPVLVHDVKFGEAVTHKDLKIEKRLLSNDYQQYFADTNIEDGMVAKSMLHEGDILRKSDVRMKPVINRGQPIDLKVKSGNILIEMEGIAKEEGSTGERIRVYNQTTRRHYFGIVESPQLVVINLD